MTTQHWKRYKRHNGRFTSEIGIDCDVFCGVFIKSKINKNKRENVYFVKCNEYIKIGMSMKPKNRIQSLQHANPYKLEEILIIYNSKILENIFHYFLYKSKKHHLGEWFIYDDFMERFIKLLKLYKESILYIKISREIRLSQKRIKKSERFIKNIENYIFNKF